MADPATLRARAAQIADDVLFPAAIAVDRAERVPAEHLDLLASEGFYGLAADDRIDAATTAAVIESLASGCLATTFVWLQHHSPVRAVAADARLADQWLPAFARGERRAGIGLAGIRPGADPLRVRATEAGFVLDGTVPWVTGWDMIDTVHVAAVDDQQVIHFLLVDAVASASLEPTLQHVVAVQASRTVNLRFSGHLVAADRLTSTLPYARWLADDTGGSTTNGFLALGVARRCRALLGLADPDRIDSLSSLDDDLDGCRDALLHGDATTAPIARATASELALHAASRLVVATGARSVLLDNHAQRLLREATFLLVFGSRPAIRSALLDRLAPMTSRPAGAAS